MAYRLPPSRFAYDALEPYIVAETIELHHDDEHHGRTTMYDVRTRLAQDLKVAVSRLRQLGGPAAVEERPGLIGNTCLFADEVDGVQASESREIGFATHELLQKRVHRLSAALDRMSEGEYGTCVECDEPISPARLDAVPEVQTCVRCQDRLERLGQLAPRSTAMVFASSETGVLSEQPSANGIASRFLPERSSRRG